jgi:hypothetical protein
MRAASTILTLALIAQVMAIITSCSFFPQFNESGRESRLKCIYLTTDSLVLNYECKRDAIEGFTIINHSISNSDSFSYSRKFDVPVTRYRLPVVRESIINKDVEILLDITNSHHREGFSIYIKPGDLNKYKKIYCSYSPL